MEAKITKKVDDKIYSLRIEVAKEQKQADELLERQTLEINEQISNLQNEIDQERKSRQLQIASLSLVIHQRRQQ